MKLFLFILAIRTLDDESVLLSWQQWVPTSNSSLSSIRQTWSKQNCFCLQYNELIMQFELKEVSMATTNSSNLLLFSFLSLLLGLHAGRCCCFPRNVLDVENGKSNSVQVFKLCHETMFQNWTIMIYMIVQMKSQTSEYLDFKRSAFSFKFFYYESSYFIFM
jgi:hypothetical protein